MCRSAAPPVAVLDVSAAQRAECLQARRDYIRALVASECSATPLTFSSVGLGPALWLATVHLQSFEIQGLDRSCKALLVFCRDNPLRRAISLWGMASLVRVLGSSCGFNRSAMQKAKTRDSRAESGHWRNAAVRTRFGLEPRTIQSSFPGGCAEFDKLLNESVGIAGEQQRLQRHRAPELLLNCHLRSLKRCSGLTASP